MQLIRFEIENFKGISKASIELNNGVPGNIVTLVGLNESGKTTILEALANFVTEDKDTATLVDTVLARSTIQEFIPKDRKAAFTGDVSVRAFCRLESQDIDALSKYFRQHHGLELNRANMNKDFDVQRTYRFEDSKFKESQTLWTLFFPLKTPRATYYKTYNHIGDTRSVWLAGLNFVRALIPKMVYFPTFLFKFPERIYLEGEEDSEVNPYYKRVLQDVLDSQGEGLSVQKHIVDRIKRERESHPTPATFVAYLFGLDEKSQIDAVLQKMSNEMSREIFGAWNQILGRDVSDKRVQVDWFVDGEKGNIPYLQVSIIDGQSKYSLGERSLGFRWFFSFLLFTQFRRNRSDGAATIFLFDEPASNLHSKAQMKLLDSFPRIATELTYIIYSTHSHYMVNPAWLEKAYIVDNRAIDYDDENQIDAFSVRKTDIKAVRYRTFVGSNPTKTTYFQPVLDALDVAFSPLIQREQAVIIEGKFDYHPVEYLRRRADAAAVPQVYPANGAGDLGCLIGLFRGWGINFKVLLDGDGPGERAKKRYLDDGLLAPHEIATLGDINTSLRGKAFESLYQDDVRSAVSARFETDTPKKRHFSLFFQELLVKSAKQKFRETEKAFAPIGEWIDTMGGDLTKPKSTVKRRQQTKTRKKTA